MLLYFQGSGIRVKDQQMMNILVVEDNEVISMRLQALLKHESCASVHAATGMETLQYLKTHTPDIIFMDIDLPDIDGVSLTKTIKTQLGNKWVPIVFHSTRVNENKRNVVSLLGGDGYISKPVQRDELHKKIESIEPIVHVLKKYGLQ